MGSSRKLLFDSSIRWHELAKNLSRSESIRRQQSGEEDDAWTLAHDFSDLEKSFTTILDELMPKLLDGDLSAAELDDVLLDIGEEFRHIIYHISNSKYFSYLAPQEATKSSL